MAIVFFLSATGLYAQLPQIKLTTSRTGIHRVTAAALANLLGQPVDQVTTRIALGNFTLLHQGQPLGWWPSTDGTEVLFHAEALHNNYTDQNVYWLVDGTNVALPTVDGAAPSPQTNGYYFAATNFAQDVYCRYELGSDPNSNYWFWANLVGSHPFRSKFSYGFALDTPGPTNATAALTVRVYGAAAATNAVALTLNGTTNLAWVGTWYGIQPTQFTFAVSANLLYAQTNTLTFTALGPLSSQWWLDGWEIDYPHPYLTASGSLLCGANSNAIITAGGFTSTNLTVLDVTQPYAPVLVTNLSITPSNGAWSVSFVPEQPGNNYSICQAGSEQDMAALSAVWPVGLANPTNRAVFVVIAPTNLLTAAQSLVDYRNQQGLETRLVSLDSIYNEFDAGLPEPKAVSDFLAYAAQYWTAKPAYALLMGNGTYDYRNVLGMGDNLVPPLMVPSLYGLVASDSQYGLPANAGAASIAVGRLPATDATQLTAMINKIKAYESVSCSNRVAVLLADLADPAAGDFPTDMGSVQSALGGSFACASILPADTASNTVTMRAELLTNLNAGADLFCYLGHGAAQRLGNAGYLTTSDIATLTNSRLPLMSAVTCLAGVYAQPGYTCLAEALVLPQQSGAIAAFTASGFSLDAEANVLNLNLMNELASGTPGRLGDFIQTAITDYNQTAHFTPSAMYNLMGDPTLIYQGSPAPPATPSISSLSQIANGNFTLTLSAQANQTYELLAATNVTVPLAAWTAISTGTVPFGPFTLTDLGATNFAQRFYRLVSPAP